MLKMIACMVLFGAASIASASAQQTSWPPNTPIKRTVLQKFDVADTNHEAIIGLAEIAPNVNIGRHSHFGVESGYVIEGDGVLIVEGSPEKPFKPGDSCQIPAGVKHDARSGGNGAKIIATYVVEKGKPFATPAP